MVIAEERPKDLLWRMPAAAIPPTDRREWAAAVILFGLLLVFHGWAVSVGWKNGNLPGNEFRQSQTALTALFIQRDADYGLAYPTPVLGQPWSVPMEFPLYQWSVVALSNVTGLPLIQAGRAVSLACFYGALAALFPLLGHFRLSPARRLVAMGLLLTCPLYIFYTRAFLIETMVLMFSLWFLVAFGRMITAPTVGRLALVAGLGVLAGLIKVTTFMVFLVPAGGWTLLEMRRTGLAEGWVNAVRRGSWALAAIFLPVVATVGWTRFADATKGRNTSAGFLESDNLAWFNFGTAGERFSAATWGAHWRHLTENIAGPAVLGITLLLLVTVSRRWWRPALVCLGVYLAPLIIFPTLYARHDYYAVTNALLLLGVAGLALAGALEVRPRWLPWALLIGVHFAQGWTYRRTYFELQGAVSPGGSDMTHAINLMTNPDEQMVVAGSDWDSSMALYSGRRALMLRNGTERNADYLNTAFGAQHGGRVTVFVARGDQRDNPLLLPLLVKYFGFDARPLFRWQDCTVYGRHELRGRMTDAIRRGTTLAGVMLDVTTASETWSVVGQEVRTADWLERDREMLALCEPKPWKFYSQFGSRLTTEDGAPALFAHPDTRLWFKVPAGPRVLRVTCGVQAAAYAGAAGDRTDGVEFFVDRERADGTRERLGSLWLNPAGHPEDAGYHQLDVPMNFADESNIVLSTGPGAKQSYTRDWALIGAVRLE
jgi:hypothetical protein